MQQSDDDWDDLDDFEIEQCVLKENEILSQHPDLQQKTFSKEKGHWINGRFNSFTDEKFIASKSEYSNVVKGNHVNDRKNNSSLPFSKPFGTAPKKQSLYKPLFIDPSSSSFHSDNVFIKKEEKGDHGTDARSLRKQIEQICQEKAKLEEENLVKQGEVYNLRCELKRKETSLETERVDQCIALEAAEKRGKDKAAKTITELELKVKTLEREVDRLEGNILFKNREVDELLAKCRQSENQASTSLHNCPKATRFSPSPKKRKLDDRFSPNKPSFNFADKFDFGDKKKVVKSVQVQTESEVEKQNRVAIQVSSTKGRINGSRKAFYLLNDLKKTRKGISGPADGTSDREYSLLAQMISFEHNSSSTTDSSEHLLVKHACSSLENLLKTTQNENPSVNRIASGYDKKEESIFLTSSIPLVKILSIAKADNETLVQNCVRVLVLCMQYFLKDGVKNMNGILSSLESLSALINQCSDIPPELCSSVVEGLKRCCGLSSVDIVPQLISSLNSLSNFENFRRKICVNINGHCLLKKFCAFLKNIKIQTLQNVICNDLTILISRLLYDEASTLIKNNTCNCSSLLLSVFVNTLYRASRMTSQDLHWQCVLNGLKALHSWQSIDRTWLEKVSQLNSYSLLLSTVIRKAKVLRAKGILDQHTWELVYDIYEIDESS